MSERRPTAFIELGAASRAAPSRLSSPDLLLPPPQKPATVQIVRSPQPPHIPRRESMLRCVCLSCLAASALAAGVSVADEPLKYPATKRIDHVDEYHGVKVPCPYQWLEKDVRESKEVADWVAAENKVTFAYLAGIPEREAIKKRITDLWNYEK